MDDMLDVGIFVPILLLISHQSLKRVFIYHQQSLQLTPLLPYSLTLQTKRLPLKRKLLLLNENIDKHLLLLDAIGF